MKLINVFTIGMVGGEGVILCLYVDDILIFGNNVNVIKKVKDFLSSNFEMKYLEEADAILNIKLLREVNGGVTLVQSPLYRKGDESFWI